MREQNITHVHGYACCKSIKAVLRSSHGLNGLHPQPPHLPPDLCARVACFAGDACEGVRCNPLTGVCKATINYERLGQPCLVFDTSITGVCVTSDTDPVFAYCASKSGPLQPLQPLCCCVVMSIRPGQVLV